MGQGKNNKGVIALLVVIIIILLALVVLLATGTISFKSNEPTNNQTSENPNNSTTDATDKKDSMDNTKEELTSSELSELNNFFDVYRNEGRSNENVSIEMISFNNPSELLIKKENSNNFYYLLIALMSSEYSQTLSTQGAGSDLITLNGIKTLLKNLTNYDYSDDDIKNYFSNIYNEEKDAYVFITPGGLPMAGEITSSYKIGDKYYISLSNNINVVLQKVNNKYYFYSSTGWTE